jgi:hypothetical protein
VLSWEGTLNILTVKSLIYLEWFQVLSLAWYFLHNLEGFVHWKNQAEIKNIFSTHKQDAFKISPI